MNNINMHNVSELDRSLLSEPMPFQDFISIFQALADRLHRGLASPILELVEGKAIEVFDDSSREGFCTISRRARGGLTFTTKLA